MLDLYIYFIYLYIWKSRKISPEKGAVKSLGTKSSVCSLPREVTIQTHTQVQSQQCLQ